MKPCHRDTATHIAGLQTTRRKARDDVLRCQHFTSTNRSCILLQLIPNSFQAPNSVLRSALILVLWKTCRASPHGVAERASLVPSSALNSRRPDPTFSGILVQSELPWDLV